MRRPPKLLRARTAALAAFLLLPRAAGASVPSAAAKNREGNRFFREQKFAQAEQAYLEAQADLPDRPELFYNLGNALIKQKKYDLGLQALRQAEARGDKPLQADSWFNIGNALFEMGNFGEAAQAYAQSLRLRPADRDAKHNLELALEKMKEQAKKPAAAEEPAPQPKQQQEQRQEQPPPTPRPSDQSRQSGGAQDEQERRQAASPKASRPESGEGTISRERALQILDALQSQELLEQRRQLERMIRRKTTGRDW